jgi:L-methionine (R)-S-oxide reductase
MAESIFIPENASKAAIYNALLPQIEALVQNETNLVANLANIAAVLKEAFGFFWVGFYLNSGKDLVLGPFQGPLACTRIAYTRGVCGHAYTTKQTIIVPNVEEFPGHIACSSASKSEIVVPVFAKDGSVAMVLDLDSDQLDSFDVQDQAGLEAIVQVLTAQLL